MVVRFSHTIKKQHFNKQKLDKNDTHIFVMPETLCFEETSLSDNPKSNQKKVT